MVSTLMGWQGEVRIKLQNHTIWTNATDPYLLSAPFDTDVAMEHIYVIGTKTAIDTKDGVMEITGSIERPYFESIERNRIVAGGDSGYTLPEVSGVYGINISKCTMLVKPVDNQTFVLHDVRFHSYSSGLAQGESTTESCDFTATNISTKDIY